MGVEVANCFHRPPVQPPVASASSQLDHRKIFASTSSGCNKCTASVGVNSLHGFRSLFWSARRRGRFHRSRSFQEIKSTETRLRRACSASLEDNNNSDDEYLQRLQELALQCHLSEENEEEEEETLLRPAAEQKGFAEYNRRESSVINANSRFQNSRFEHTGEVRLRPFPSVKPDTNFYFPEPEWKSKNLNVSRLIPVTLEKKADDVGLPLSLRILKRKQCKERGIDIKPEGFRDSLMEVGEAACCSVRKAFSSMVFMIRELQNYTLQMRQILCYGDMQELVSSVQREMHASFVWLFQQVFSCTPCLMVSVMILLANFTVYSMGNNVALATVPPPMDPPSAIVSILEDGKGAGNLGLKEDLGKFVAENPNKLSDLSSFSSSRFEDLSAESQRLLNMGDGASGGGSGGGNSVIAGGTDGGDAHFDGTSQNRAMYSEENLNSLNRFVSSIANPATGDITNSRVEESVSAADHITKEVKQWEAFLREAYEELESGNEEEALEHETMQNFVSPITVQLEPDNYACYDRTNLHYQLAINADPENPLLLSNYAQFLHLVTHDHDRAEDYFQRAMKVDPSDGEIIGRYAHFLWLAQGDLPAAEQAFLDAIAADPGNPSHAGSYAHFLWNTGGEDTCYPLS